MIAAKITSKGQVTIPKKVREKLGSSRVKPLDSKKKKWCTYRKESYCHISI